MDGLRARLAVDAARRRDVTEAAVILAHRSDRRDQSGGYGEASRRLAPMLLGRGLLAVYWLFGWSSRLTDTNPGG